MREFAELLSEAHAHRSRLIRVFRRQVVRQKHRLQSLRRSNHESDVHLFIPNWSQGLQVDASVITGAAEAIGLRHDSLNLPANIYQVGQARTLEMLKINSFAPAAIFIERLFDHPDLKRYSRRIFIPNPEHLDANSLRLAGVVSEVWHKTRFSLAQLEKLFPRATHRFLGFTSPRPRGHAADYRLFCHLRGKSPYRHTQHWLDIWSEHPNWPTLHVHVYSSGTTALSAPGWLHGTNFRLRMGYLDADEYFDMAWRYGIHLCSSEVEGFGHYINEARALAAVPVVLDAPPMNELVDKESGFLIPVCESSTDQQGIRYKADKHALAKTVELIVDTTTGKLAEIGAKAQSGYETERIALDENFKRAWLRE